MRKTLLLLALFSLFLSADNKKITLQLNWLNQFQFAGYYVAIEKGFYNDVGLDVNIKEFTTNTDLVESIKNADADFAVGRSSLLIEKINGKDIVGLAAIFQKSPLMLLVKKDSNIKSVKDLKNKKIMITADAGYSASILAMLSANGLNQNDYIAMEHSFDIDDLIEGKVDAMASYLSNEPIILKDKGIEYRVFHPKDYGFYFYSDILFTSSKFIKNNPKLTKDFYEASIKGWEYAFENSAETAEIIYKKYNTQNKSYIHLVKEGEILKKLAYTNNKGLGDIDKNRLENIINVFRLFGLVKNHVDEKDFIYEENHNMMVIELSKRNQKLILIFITLVFIIFLVVMYFLNKTKQLKELLHTVINSTDDLIFYKDSRFRYLGCNKSFEKFCGKKEAKIIGKTDFELFENEYAQSSYEKDKEVLSKNKLLVNNEWAEIEKSNILLQTKKVPFKYKKTKDNGILGISRNITELHEVHERLKKQAYRDELTSIYNRKAYNERIEEKFDLYNRYKSKFCLAMYDIDDFKVINDTYGHDIGDKVLVEMTKEIRDNIRKTDLIFRVGGEEFVIIFPKTLLNEAFVVTEKIREIVSKMNMVDNKTITISIGITEVKDSDTPTSIYERIDKLMYVSKHSGKNQTSRD
ncbi:MAG: ABC transporter substrate-binding protein [Arcobacter sp.]|uniref:ABC transporter substrate-binding protein n=1 Tax=Arcobacter sp. TaxID=1872629 RepID=UPI003B002C6D